MTIITIIAAALIGYFWGAIPFGKIYVKLATGQDIQQIGSGRTGGTNSMRAAGVKVGFLTGLSDVAKGFLAVITTRWLLAGLVSPDLLPWLEVSSGILAVIGHNWSIFAGWKGGAGTGPNVGWATAIWLPMFPIGFAVMAGMIFFVGYASVGSMMMALIIPITFGVLYALGFLAGTVAYIIGGIMTALIVAFALRGNFRRLFRGEERLVGLRARRRKAKQQQMEVSN